LRQRWDTRVASPMSFSEKVRHKILFDRSNILKQIACYTALRTRRLLPDFFPAISDYRKKHGAFPNVIRPRTFNEKVQHRILFDRRTLLTQMADKAAVRSYVESRLGPQVLPKLYCLTAHPDAIPFEELPQKFVVKPTHGSGWVQVVNDKSALDSAALIERCRGWLDQSYYEISREWAYKHIEPRILVEEFIEDGTGASPNDYKLFVFGGTVQMIQVDAGRFSDHRRRLYSTVWKKLDVLLEWDDIIGEVPRPPHLAEMIAAAETLGRGIDFVRADFYDTAGQLYFGELTTTPGCGRDRFYPKEFDLYFGGFWKHQ
jgi:hypothetical protein